MNQNEWAFQEVYDAFHAKIHRYLERLVGRDEAEDLTQEVFVKVDKGLVGFKGTSKLSTWIYRIATNTALDRLRSPAFQQVKQSGSLSEATEASVMDGGNTRNPSPALGQVIEKEMSRCIRSFVDELPEDYRTAIALSELKELKNREIAEILGISLNTVKIRLHRARTRLRKEFETGCDFYRDERDELACNRKSS